MVRGLGSRPDRVIVLCSEARFFTLKVSRSMGKLMEYWVITLQWTAIQGRGESDTSYCFMPHNP